MVNIEAKFDAEVGLRVGVDFLCLHGFSFSTVFWNLLDVTLMDFETYASVKGVAGLDRS
jgi:hypothetical protein